MFAGFDYGTSNCAIGVFDTTDAKPDQVSLLPLHQDQRLVPSCLYALSRELICDSVARNIASESMRESYMAERQGQLRMAAAVKRELDIRPGEQVLFVGEEAVENYIDLPDEGYFVKSPKSFLGAGGLRAEHLAFFEDIVTAMMQWIKQAAERRLGQRIRQAVIGRPVNFQGSGGEEANRQACGILLRAAERAGFEQAELLFEPIAAGIDFETGLERDQTVLVVDVGGGTTDCSVVRMGPSYRDKVDRQADFLGHSGERVGGNDLDIHLSYKALMPLFGLGDLLKTGRPLPTQPYWNAVSVNDIAAQGEFNSLQNIELMKQLCLDAEHPARVRRLLALQRHKQNYQLVRSGEQCKIALSEAAEHRVPLDYIEAELSQTVCQSLYEEAVERPVSQVVKLMVEVLQQAQCRPDLIYVTGGTAKSPVVRRAIARQLGDIQVVDGDHFGSVAAGLTKWAARLYR
ncbi:molecular chaperone [Marinobacterium arenosum]|uniref:molecular chaperone n=1 Tax=Marinobacterium arenosum TaxID=2862496 RepID=UPI001C946405|nr:molecular chaperone [Marinobacterium arenosum]MBY4678747.1 molecular chaperone [Marinobacterium arenosum]